MKKLNKSIRVLFFVSLFLSIGFPAGIVGIVFGATGKMVALMVAGIVFTVAGFYVMPILWVRFGEKIGWRRLLVMIERDNLYTVQSLARQTHKDEQVVRDVIRKLINSDYLVGYLFENDTLILNQNQKQKMKQINAKCINCGAIMVHDGTKNLCEYCGYSED